MDRSPAVYVGGNWKVRIVGCGSSSAAAAAAADEV